MTDDRLWVLWCLNEWDGRTETLEDEILHAIKAVKDKRDMGIVRDDSILMDFTGTELQSKKFKADNFKPEVVTVEHDHNVPSMHIQIPIIQRTPVKYSGERKPA